MRKSFWKRFRAGEKEYHFIEIYGLPGRLRKRRRTADCFGKESRMLIREWFALRAFMTRTVISHYGNPMKTGYPEAL